MNFIITSVFISSLLISHNKQDEEQTTEKLSQLTARLRADTIQAYDASPYSAFSKDYFSRFCRNPNAQPIDGEVIIDETWQIILPTNATLLSELIVKDFVDFMSRCMGLQMLVVHVSPSAINNRLDKKTVFLDTGGGDAKVAESFVIAIDSSEVRVCGRNPRGLCDGIVKLVDMIGFRQALFLTVGEQVYKPRLNVRLGKILQLGSCRDLVFMGYNAVLIGESSFYALSTSDAIPELNVRRGKGFLESIVKDEEEADWYCLKTFIFINTRKKFAKDDPVFFCSSGNSCYPYNES